MANLPKKSPSLIELQGRMANILGQLGYYNALLKMDRLVEQKPVTLLIDQLAETMLQMKVKGSKFTLDLTNWAPELRDEMELNKKVGHYLSQMRLKEELLKKHGIKKLRQFQQRMKRSGQKLLRK